jgi:hypothetical protein
VTCGFVPASGTRTPDMRQRFAPDSPQGQAVAARRHQGMGQPSGRSSMVELSAASRSWRSAARERVSFCQLRHSGESAGSEHPTIAKRAATKTYRFITVFPRLGARPRPSQPLSRPRSGACTSAT